LVTGSLEVSLGEEVLIGCLNWLFNRLF
jgi:hypothetical protein